MHKRLLTLFKLLNESDDKITCKTLSNHLKVSERTIRNDITSINETLEKNGAIIKIKKGEGYYIDILNLALYQHYLALISDDIMDSSEIPDSPIERNQYILKYILYNNTYIKLEDLANSLYVSKFTILNDIKRIKPILSKYNLILVSKPYYGVKVEGKEIDIRRCISNNMINRNFENYIIGITDREIELFNNVDLIELQKIVLSEINKFNINFLDFNLKNFIIHLSITISRILGGYC
ncbi:TPA: HTH domain-containing protein, partial [Clostridioides difficile]|nr:HTH domain-containing protein [Clostridioides difficile]